MRPQSKVDLDFTLYPVSLEKSTKQAFGMVSHPHRCIFIHIPKAAGQSIETAFLQSLGLSWESRKPLLLMQNDCPDIGPPYLAHLRAEEYVAYSYISPSIFEDYFKFTIVRNPWSRLVSTYKYLGYQRKCSFKYFLNEILESTLFSKKLHHVRPQCDYIYNSDDKLLVDFVGRFESLDEDFIIISNSAGLASNVLPHVNSSKHLESPLDLRPASIARYLNYNYRILIKNIPIYKDYRDYYDTESIKKVGLIYERDIDLLNYKY